MTNPADSWLESIAPEHVDAIGKFVLGRLDGESTEMPAGTGELLDEERGPVFLGLRTGGALKFSAWLGAENQREGLEQAIDEAREQLDAETLDGIETAEICLSYGFRAHDLRNKRERQQLMSNVFRGIRGLEIGWSDQFRYISPTVMLETNLGWKDVLEEVRKELGLSQETFESGRVRFRQFRNAQLLIKRKKKEAVKLFRGFRLIPVEEVTREGVENLQQVLGDYLYNNVGDDGRLVYMYDAGIGERADMGTNMIRQFMATIAMSRTAHYRGRDEKLYDIVERNIRFNLRNYYKARGSLGLIEYGNMVKLGAVALAAISLVEHPKRDEFSRPERKLFGLIEHLWQPNGRFKTFYKPAKQDTAHNFYPGEALLAWSYKLEEKLDPKILNKFMQSYRHYKEWHLDPQHRNPAFIPWHTQAYYKVFKKTEERELVDWIFEMNDWLIDAMQQWEGTMYPDAMGRFYSPKVGKYGPPHASSTGVYMEGIIDAFCLARQFGDEERRERYRLSLVRGLRSCMQLTYWNDTDMFYVKEPERVRGGVRTTVYNTRIRVDNIQHNLMAILKILENFEDDDFRHP